jgi:hypothetical protein
MLAILIFSKLICNFNLDKTRQEFQNKITNKLMEVKFKLIYSDIFRCESSFNYYSNTLIVFKNYVPDLDSFSDTLVTIFNKNKELGILIKYHNGNKTKSNLNQNIIDSFNKHFYVHLDLFEPDYKYYTDGEDDVLELDIFQRKSERIRNQILRS